MSEKIIRVWLATEFEGGRHARRTDKITAYERCHMKTDSRC
jgi:ribose 5-phosphate isomerase B